MSPAMSLSITISSNLTPTKPFGNTALQTNSVACFREYANMFFIHNQQMPHHKWAIYGRICCNYCPQKNGLHCTWLTVGGDQITHNGNNNTFSATLLTAKLLINSTISTPKVKFYGMDLANFYLMTFLKECEYMRLWLKTKIICQYNLRDHINEQGWVYIKIWMGVYSLPQTGNLVNNTTQTTTGIIIANTHRACGAMYGMASTSVSWPTTLASNPHLGTTSSISRPL